ncbi:MAG TPA: hypothetical protein VFQ70_00980, partial [Candidatus Saccharimonadaceae bacterium]|nr:hypothetical protein [Candidatus Saccharimonadaceae bacterium]
AYEDYQKMRAEQIDPRVRYALGSVAGKKFALSDVASAMREYAAETSVQGDDSASRQGRLGRAYRLIIGALNDPASVEEATLSYSHTALPRPDIVPSVERRGFTYAKYTPDSKDPSKHWLSLSDRRTIVGDGAAEGVVESFAILATRPHEGGDGSEVLWANGDGSRLTMPGTSKTFRDKLSTTTISGMQVPTWTIELTNGSKEVRYVASVTETGDNSISVHYFNRNHNLQVTRVTEGHDTYRVKSGRIEVFVPAGRISLGALIEREEADAIFDEFITNKPETASVALQAAGQTQRPIYDTFRPINTGRSGVPQVNPRPIFTGKQN